MTIYKKPDEFSVPFYIYVFQAFYSFGSYMEALKYINHDDKQTCKVICHLFSREIGKNISSGPYFWLFQEASNCWKTSGSSTSEVTHCFQALARQCLCSGDEAEVVLIHSKIRINTKVSCMVNMELQAHPYGGSNCTPKWRIVLSNKGFACMA